MAKERVHSSESSRFPECTGLDGEALTNFLAAPSGDWMGPGYGEQCPALWAPHIFVPRGGGGWGEVRRRVKWSLVMAKFPLLTRHSN